MEHTVVIDEEPMSIAELVAVADGARLELGPAAKAAIAASRAVVDEVLVSGRLVYGLNSGLGHLKDTRIADADLLAYQQDMLAAHAGGVGPPLPDRVVRAAITARVNGIARGGAGASPAVAETFVAMLNAGVHPVVPTVGSVGASDLMHMAAIGLVATGRGEARIGNEVLPGGEALTRAGIAPLVPQPKDGLAILNADGMSVGHAALVVDHAARVAEHADVVLCLSLEAIGGNTSIIEARVAEAKPVRGQIDAARHMREVLADSYLWDAKPRTIQDPLSFRAAPQVHGAFREVVASAAQAVVTELNARDDNPLVADGTITSNGNFHPVLMALNVDALRPAIVHAAQISERRLQHLAPGVWKDLFAEGPLPGTLLYSAAALVAEVRSLAGPATLDCPPVDFGIEDHATSAHLAVRQTEQTLALLLDVLAIELLVAVARVRRAGTAVRLGAGTAKACQALHLRLAREGDHTTARRMHAVARAALDALA